MAKTTSDGATQRIRGILIGAALGALPTVAAPAPGQTLPPVASSSSARTEDIPFTDAHVHLNDLTAQLTLMREANVPRAIIFWGRASSNAMILEAARAHPDRFVPFVSISPERAAYRSLWASNDTSILAQLSPPTRVLVASGNLDRLLRR